MADLDAGDLSDAVNMVRDRRLRSEERWQKLGNGGLVTAAIFGAATAHGIWTGDDLAGLVMTIVPGLAMLGFWLYARLRVAQIVEGRRPGIVQRAVSWTLIAAAIAVVAMGATSRHEGRRQDDHAGVRTPIYLGSELETGYIDGPNGTRIPSLVRKRP